MTFRSRIHIMAFVFCLAIVFTACGQTISKGSDQKINNQKIQVDTSTTAIISFDKNGSYPFDSTCNPSALTQDELNGIDSFLVACISDYNHSLKKDNVAGSIDLKKYNYHKQLVAVTNKKGEKEVWVNCFCDSLCCGNWKTNIIMVEDGGNCYFNFKINLTARKFYALIVNGLG